jgi:NADH-quinone oxidoreductase subunit D
LTGSANTETRTRGGWLARLTQAPQRYIAIDGGAGAHLIAALHGSDPRLQIVDSPRHADLLLVIEPISRTLAPAVAELARAVPQPAHALIVVAPTNAGLPQADFVRAEELLPGARRIAAQSGEQVRAAMLDTSDWPALAVADEPRHQPDTIALRPKREREIATELAVLSLGPVQPFTAGPLRLLLVCDGEQVLTTQIEAGYAQRGIAEAMLAVDWQAAARLARLLDPLAPIAAQLVYVRAVEQLQGWQPSPPLTQLREAALALERAQNHLWWLVRLARALAAPSFAEHAHQVATALAAHAASLWRRSPSAWIAPQASTIAVDRTAVPQIRQIADTVAALQQQLSRNRLLALRTRGIGVLTAGHLHAAGLSGPVLWASERGAGDVQSRLDARLEAAIADLRVAAEGMSARDPDADGPARWEAPAGEARVAVEGPRGQIGLRLASAGGKGPTQVEWQRPSAALLALVPELLAGQKLADAEVIVASLDLAMAEADG